MKNIHSIIIKPLITEKSAQFAPERKYFFQVRPDANKIEIRKAVESLFKVKVLKVNTLTVLGKNRRQGKFEGKAPDWKKAVVTLKEGQIDFESAVK